MAETRRKFDQDFKARAVRLVRETGMPIAQVARDLGVNEATLRKWVNADRSRRGESGGGPGGDESAARVQLHKENAGLTTKEGNKETLPAQTRITGTGEKKPRRFPILPILVAIIAAAAGTTVTLIGVSNVPRWGLALLAAGVTLVGAFSSNGLTASTAREKLISLWLAIAFLVIILVGQWIFQATLGSAFVNIVPINNVTLSPTPGAKPRTNYDAPVLNAGEEQSAYCDVKIGNQVWLNFRDGWAPLSDFRNVEGFALQLPTECTSP